eukprot:355369-Chlamydomonas_euryale.AAC.7
MQVRNPPGGALRAAMLPDLGTKNGRVLQPGDWCRNKSVNISEEHVTIPGLFKTHLRSHDVCVLRVRAHLLGYGAGPHTHASPGSHEVTEYRKSGSTEFVRPARDTAQRARYSSSLRERFFLSSVSLFDNHIFAAEVVGPCAAGRRARRVRSSNLNAPWPRRASSLSLARYCLSSRTVDHSQAKQGLREGEMALGCCGEVPRTKLDMGVSQLCSLATSCVVLRHFVFSV